MLSASCIAAAAAGQEKQCDTNQYDRLYDGSAVALVCPQHELMALWMEDHRWNALYLLWIQFDMTVHSIEYIVVKVIQQVVDASRSK